MSRSHHPTSDLLGFAVAAQRFFSVVNAVLVGAAFYLTDDLDSPEDVQSKWPLLFFFGLGCALAMVSAVARRWGGGIGRSAREKIAIGATLGAAAIFMIGSFMGIYVVTALG